MKFPPVMVRLLEGYCEESLKGLDPHWGLMQLKKRCLDRSGAPDGGGMEAWETSVPAPCSPWRHAGVRNPVDPLPEARGERTSGGRREAGPGTTKKERRGRRKRAPDRAARERFQRIRLRDPQGVE